jgi:O-acetyl-ADP-ribose deacetylase (regulator of RNase III)
MPVRIERHILSCGAGKIELVTGDITKIAVDAIVNAANSALAGGGGVDGAIHRAGGPSIMKELDEIRARTGGCPTGRAVATSAGRLPAKYVFHAVGPVYRGGRHGEAELLRSCYVTCLELANERSVHSVSFPSISTGIYGYPLDEAAAIAISSVCQWLNTERRSVTLVKLIQFSAADHAIYQHAALA